jgi:hypothetical protein
MEGCGKEFHVENNVRNKFCLWHYSTYFTNVCSSKQKPFLNKHWEFQYRHKINNLYLPQANLTTYQKGAYYMGITIFNNLPMEIQNVASNPKKIKIALKQLYTYSYYIGISFKVLSWWYIV